MQMFVNALAAKTILASFYLVIERSANQAAYRFG
jgi:hypothetical protein